MNQDERANMHAANLDTVALREAIFDYARERMSFNPAPLDSPLTLKELQSLAPNTVNEAGLGGKKALDVFAEVLAPACLSTDHPGYLSFIPTAPTEAATLFDLVVSASSIYGGSWMEGAGAVYAENEVLAWLARETGLPETSGGVFVQGGTLGNLSALVAARHAAMAKREAEGLTRPTRRKFICSSEAHSSLKSAAQVMDVEIIKAQATEDGRLTGAAVQAAVDSAGDGVFAIVATAGTTNFGIVDRIREVGEVANRAGIWFHVDGAYGLAGILSPKTKDLFDGTALADSFIVDPHKWLFAPFDACALVYRNPALAKAAHTQHGEYLDTLTESDDWNPSDYAYNLTRRVRGLPLWFSLATHGIAAYRQAVTENIELAHRVAEEIRRRPNLRLVREPELSVVVFEHDGWTIDDYNAWSDYLLEAGKGLVVPSSHRGKPNTRFAIVNPQTTYELLIELLDTMESR
jgi:glutamate/tyrosine decarboxylase-like PLP-dependent enzyme